MYMYICIICFLLTNISNSHVTSLPQLMIYTSPPCHPLPSYLLFSHTCSYFSVESTQEMLDEWRPLLCPFDLAMVEGLTYIYEFLPTLPAQLVGDQGHRCGAFPSWEEGGGGNVHNACCIFLFPPDCGLMS